MSTHSTIIVSHDNKVTSQFCHWDGGLNNVGTMLVTFYNSIDSLLKIISLGAIHSLKETIEKSRFFFQDGVVSEKYNTKTFKNLYDAINGADTQYIYVFTDEKWHIVVGDFLVPLQTNNEMVYRYSYVEREEIPY